MTEQSGIALALEVLGDKIAETEQFMLKAERDLNYANRELESQKEKNKELAEQLKRAEEDRDTACAYALQLEQLLEEYRKACAELEKGGAENCKKSQ